jgi:hypothetical protein
MVGGRETLGKAWEGAGGSLQHANRAPGGISEAQGYAVVMWPFDVSSADLDPGGDPSWPAPPPPDPLAGPQPIDALAPLDGPDQACLPARARPRQFQIPRPTRCPTVPPPMTFSCASVMPPVVALVPRRHSAAILHLPPLANTPSLHPASTSHRSILLPMASALGRHQQP